jgi:uncharacterized delta-60 repeat protein
MNTTIDAMLVIGHRLFIERLVAGILCLLWLGLPSALIAQVPAWLNTIVDGPVTTILVQPDGRILLGGRFASVNNRTVTNLARLMPNGSLDTSFQPGSTNVDVRTLAFQDDGRILVQGFYGIERLNTDGTPDTSFRPFRGAVKSMLLQQDHKILLRLWGQSLPMRLNTNGSPDEAFTPAVPFGQTAKAIGLQRDGKILVGLTSATNPNYRLSRLTQTGSFEGQLLESSNSWEGSIYQQDEKLLLYKSDETTVFPNTPALDRWNSDGTWDSNFRPRTLSIPHFALQSDGKILVVDGVSPAFGELTFANLWRLSGDGTLDPSFPSTGRRSISGPLALEADGSVVFASYISREEGGTNTLNYYLYRVRNPTAAMESLLVSGSTITWLRAGAAPLAWRTTFERSSNGTDWEFLGNGEPIAGCWQLHAAGLQTGDIVRARGYVITDNGYGATSSFVESKATVGGLALLRSPIDRTHHVGTIAQFAAAVAGASPVVYQWQKDGVNMQGASQSVLEIPRVKAADSGLYSVILTNISGSITSAVARLQVLQTPTILTQPFSQKRTSGSSATLKLQAAGAEPFVYQWSKDGFPVEGANNPVLALQDTSEAHVGDYTVSVSNAHGSVSSIPAKLQLIQPVTMGLRVRLGITEVSITNEGVFRMTVEASPDLVHWEDIRTYMQGMSAGKSFIAFSYTSAKRYTNRFYRVRIE